MIRIENLQVTYRGRGTTHHAVRNLSLSVAAGGFYALLGPSGCGKTTTLRAVAGLERPTSGRIVVGDVTVFSPEEGIHVEPHRRNIGMVFQSYAIWPHMTVFENVAFPLRRLRPRPSRDDIRRRVLAALALVQLQGLEERPAPFLSGGQQQRLALARALVFEPRVLLLDEPLSNLDAKLREDMRLELRDLVKRLGITTLFVTHEQVEALTMSDVVAVMRDGRLVQEGAPADIYRHPNAAFVADFIGKSNFLPGKVQSLLQRDGQAMVLVGTSIADFECRATPGLTTGSDVLVAVRPENLTVISSIPDGHAGGVAGVVENVIYLGNLVELVVRVGDQHLRVQHLPSSVPEKGARVTVSFMPGSLNVLHADP